MNVKEANERRLEYRDKVDAIGKYIQEMSEDELLIHLKYFFRMLEWQQAQIEKLQNDLEITVEFIIDNEQRLAGHNSRAAIFNQCGCEWCLNNSAAERVLS